MKYPQETQGWRSACSSYSKGGFAEKSLGKKRSEKSLVPGPASPRAPAVWPKESLELGQNAAEVATRGSLATGLRQRRIVWSPILSFSILLISFLHRILRLGGQVGLRCRIRCRWR